MPGGDYSLPGMLCSIGCEMVFGRESQNVRHEDGRRGSGRRINIIYVGKKPLNFEICVEKGSIEFV